MYYAYLIWFIMREYYSPHHHPGSPQARAKWAESKPGPAWPLAPNHPPTHPPGLPSQDKPSRCVLPKIPFSKKGCTAAET